MKFEVVKIKNDINGNPRYIIPADDISFSYKEAYEIARMTGFKKYRKKGTKHFVFSTYNLNSTLTELKKNINNFKEAIKE